VGARGGKPIRSVASNVVKSDTLLKIQWENERLISGIRAGAAIKATGAGDVGLTINQRGGKQSAQYEQKAWALEWMRAVHFSSKIQCFW
jgi:hypothetical protein